MEIRREHNRKLRLFVCAYNDVYFQFTVCSLLDHKLLFCITQFPNITNILLLKINWSSIFYYMFNFCLVSGEYIERTTENCCFGNNRVILNNPTTWENANEPTFSWAETSQRVRVFAMNVSLYDQWCQKAQMTATSPNIRLV